MNLRIASIVDSIKSGRCILILGSEIRHINPTKFKIPQSSDFDTSLQLAYNYYLSEVLDEDDKRRLGESKIQFTDYSFAHENLMNQKSGRDEEHIYEFMNWYFSQADGWQEEFEKIASIPFPLVISLLPDNGLQKAFDKVFAANKQKYNMSWYSRENQPTPPVEQVPTKEQPLLYKLLGDLEHYDATFTFDNWFDYFKNIFGRQPLPQKIEFILQQNPLILFLGVRFDKWYIQLLIRLLISEAGGGLIKGKRFFSSTVKEHEDEIETLIWDRFRLSYEETTPEAFLQALYDQCAKENILRVAQNNPDQINANVFISYNHADMALALRLRADLEKVGINVILDTDNPIGFDIPKFINQSIEKADFILQLISENFLTSAWVSQESVKAFTIAEITGKVVLPCEIDQSLSDASFRGRALTKFEATLANLKLQISDRLDTGGSIEDLQSQYQRTLSLKNNYDVMMAQFINKNRGNLQETQYEQGLQQVLTSIKTYLKQS